MKTFLTEYFYYTRTERNGALVLSVLCVMLFIVPQFFPYFLPTPESPDFDVLFASSEQSAAMEVLPDETDLALFEFDPNTATKEDFILLGLSPKLAQTIVNYRNKGGKFYRAEDLQRIYTMTEKDYDRLAPYIRIGAQQKQWTKKQDYLREQATVVLFAFDPNTATKADFQKLGLSEKISGNIVKYREKGGTFHKPEDLKKIYGLSEQDYQRLEPYILLPEQFQPQMKTPVATTSVQSPDFSSRATKSAVSIDINQATIEEWQQLHGIGAAFAKRIVGFREKLGGFSSIGQVAETYGLPDSTFQQIKPQLIFSPVFRKIAINKASVEELKAHPYIDSRLAAALISYRNQHGAFSSVADVARLKALPPPLLEKLKPYLSFD